MFRIRGTVHNYAWGNETGIQEVIGLETDGTPVAEYWLGAHLKAPATLGDGSTLSAYLANNRDALGDDTRFGDRLPFLMKLLSARTALSIQAHPSREQAQAGFAFENSAGIDLSAPNRNYRDAWHKPEMIYALTHFDALCGFRPVGAIRATFERLAEATSGPDAHLVGTLLDILCGPDPLRATLACLLDEPAYAGLADRLAAAPPAPVDAGHPSREASTADPIDTMVRVNADFPTDSGALVTLMLNMLTLQPGQALALEAGVLHAYLGGFGVEIMASSDNVLRGGLTAKHVDVPELQRVVTYESAMPNTLNPTAGEWVSGRTDDFALLPLNTVDTVVDVPGPAIALCVDGTYTLTADSQHELRRGESVFVPAWTKHFDVRGDGQMFIASVKR